MSNLVILVNGTESEAVIIRSVSGLIVLVIRYFQQIENLDQFVDNIKTRTINDFKRKR